MKFLKTRKGRIRLPAYVPVTTFGGKYPLDDLIRPYLPRLASAAMVSWHFANQMQTEPQLPLFLDSGGFASLFEGSRIIKRKGVAVLETNLNGEAETIHPRDVLDLQERIADVAFTLDFPIPPSMTKREATRRQRLTIENAMWALENRRRKDMLLFGCIQAWDTRSARANAKAYAGLQFDGVAIGGLVPRARDVDLIRDIVGVVREEIPDLPVHVFGLGKPDVVKMLYAMGVDSVDSSSYVKLAARGQLWSDKGFVAADPSPADRLHLAICNLAEATQVALPISASRIAFGTRSLQQAH